MRIKKNALAICIVQGSHVDIGTSYVVYDAHGFIGMSITQIIWLRKPTEDEHTRALPCLRSSAASGTGQEFHAYQS